MTTQKITKEEYLDKNFDYTKLTKQELRQIMSENDVQDIPHLTSLKSAILDAYKTHIFDRIDELKGKFSEQNIFQKEKPKSRKTDSSRVESSFITADSSFTVGTEHFENSTAQIGSSFINKSYDLEENSAPVSKVKIPFIAIPKKKLNLPEIETVVEKAKGNRKTFKTLRILGLLVLSVCLYLKFFCPYCKPGLNYCIPVPPHTRLVKDKLVVDDGFRLVKSIIDFCVPDNQFEQKIHRKVDEYIKKLEVLFGDFKYGMARSPKMNISVISDPRVLEELIKTNKLIIQNGTMQAKRSRVTFSSFLKYYFYFLIKFAFALVLFIILLKIHMNRRKAKKEIKKTAVSVSKEVLDILNRQIMMSVKSSQFKPQISSIQMKEALEIKEDVWKFVEELVSKNSNVEKTKDENGIITWKWIGPVFYKSSEHVDYQ